MAGGVRRRPEEIDSLFPNDPDDFVRLFGTVWRWEDIGTLVVTLVASALLFLLFAKTKVGLAMRAVASNPESSKLVGVPTKLDPRRLVGLAGALAALAGVMVAGAQAQVTPTMMFTIFVYASAAATLGGLDSPIGAVVGGLVDRRRRERRRRVRSRLGRPGDEAVGRPAVHLRRAASSSRPACSAPRKWNGSDAMPRRRSTRARPGTGRSACVWVAATVAFVVYIPTRTQVGDDRRHDDSPSSWRPWRWRSTW